MRTSTVATIAAGLTAAGATVLTVSMLTPAGQAQRVTPRTVMRLDGTKASHSVSDGFRLSARPSPDSTASGAATTEGVTTREPRLLSDGSTGSEEKGARSEGSILTSGPGISGEAARIGAPVTVRSTISGRFRARTFRSPPVLPVSFQEVSAGCVALTSQQVAGVEWLQEQFFTDIGGERADPSSPYYLEKWQRAQPIADQRLRAMIGAQAFAAWQAEAYLRSRQERTGK